MDKKAKDLKIGEVFNFRVKNPDSLLVLKVLEFEGNTPWCLVIEHTYYEKAKDKYEEEDRYKKGDIFPYVYTDVCSKD